MPHPRMRVSVSALAIGLFLHAAPSPAQTATAPGTEASASDSINAATNPTTPKLTFQAWDNWLPRAAGAGGRAGNTLLSRNIIPVRTFGVMNLFHAELPVVSNPNVRGGTNTGIGGTVLYNFSVLKVGTTTYGAGPLIVLPTEANTHLGAQKWQAGLATVILDSPKWGLVGGIFTYQHGFGKGSGPVTQQASFQTLIHYNLRGGTFLQSEGNTVMTSHDGVRVVPVGLGMGKVWRYASGGTFSAFIEPQYSVWHRGEGAPTWQLFSGISVQIPRVFKLWSK